MNEPKTKTISDAIERVKSNNEKIRLIKENFTTLFKFDPFTFFLNDKRNEEIKDTFYKDSYELYKAISASSVSNPNKAIEVAAKLNTISENLLNAIIPKDSYKYKDSPLTMQQDMGFIYLIYSVMAFNCFLNQIQITRIKKDFKDLIEGLEENIIFLKQKLKIRICEQFPKENEKKYQLKINITDNYEKVITHFLFLSFSSILKEKLTNEQVILFLNSFKKFSNFTDFQILSAKETLSFKQYLNSEIISELFKNLTLEEKITIICDPMSNNYKMSFEYKETDNTIVLNCYYPKNIEKPMVSTAIKDLPNLTNQTKLLRDDNQRNLLAIVMQKCEDSMLKGERPDKNDKNLFCEFISTLIEFKQRDNKLLRHSLPIFSLLCSYKEKEPKVVATRQYGNKTILNKAIELIQAEEFRKKFDESTINNISKLGECLNNGGYMVLDSQKLGYSSSFGALNRDLFFKLIPIENEKNNIPQLQLNEENQDLQPFSASSSRQRSNRVQFSSAQQAPQQNWTRATATQMMNEPTKPSSPNLDEDAFYYAEPTYSSSNNALYYPNSSCSSSSKWESYAPPVSPVYPQQPIIDTQYDEMYYSPEPLPYKQQTLQTPSPNSPIEQQRQIQAYPLSPYGTNANFLPVVSPGMVKSISENALQERTEISLTPPSLPQSTLLPPPKKSAPLPPPPSFQESMKLINSSSEGIQKY